MGINHGDRPAMVKIAPQSLTEISFMTEDPRSAASDEKVAWKTEQSATSLRRPSVFRGEKFGI
jgi:hypothetical protein